jgi:hypothetical protein
VTSASGAIAIKDRHRPGDSLFGLSALAMALCCVGTAWAKTLEVGPDQEFKAPSKAIAAAADGDVVEIAPVKDGYFDCAVLRANHLTVEGKGADVVLTDKTCEGKAIFVTAGNDITIRNITFTRARVPDGNGAGIRAEGSNLTVEKSRFINNENGILAADAPDSTIRILDSEFTHNGKCQNACAHGIYVGSIALLHIEGTKFFDTRDGHHVKSRAARTELIGNDIEDGPNGTSSYLVDISNGGTLIMENNILEKGPHSTNARAAIMIGSEDSWQKPTELTFVNNSFINVGSATTAFVLNWSGVAPRLEGNRLRGQVVLLSDDGLWVHRLRECLGWVKARFWRMAHRMKDTIAAML